MEYYGYQFDIANALVSKIDSLDQTFNVEEYLKKRRDLDKDAVKRFVKGDKLTDQDIKALKQKKPRKVGAQANRATPPSSSSGSKSKSNSIKFQNLPPYPLIMGEEEKEEDLDLARQNQEIESYIDNVELDEEESHDMFVHQLVEKPQR